MQKKELPQHIANKVLNELVNSEPHELDELEKKLLGENSGFSQRISNLDSQIKHHQNQIEQLTVAKHKLEGKAEYVMTMAVEHRWERTSNVDAPDDPSLGAGPLPGERRVGVPTKDGEVQPDGAMKSKRPASDGVPSGHRDQADKGRIEPAIARDQERTTAETKAPQQGQEEAGQESAVA